jgi:maltooligosyltrehalose trehalohydrolase
MRRAGHTYSPTQTSFCVWAPEKKTISLHIVHPEEMHIDMQKSSEGYFESVVPNLPAEAKYFFRIENEDLADPASYFQPDGVFGPSQIVNHAAFQWTDTHWQGIQLRDMIFYEVHVGTFTPSGTFEAIISRLDDLIDTGINAIQLMPVSQFSGRRNWGYDGVFPYAAQNSYGGPDGLKRLVDACHLKGIAVFLDVVYNHIGPEGSVLKRFGPYFTDKHKIPWGDAVNLNGAWCDGVREYFVGNAMYWFEHFHIDGLRLDAIHMMYDDSAISFWELLSTATREMSRRVGRELFLMAESDLNSPRVIKPIEQGGYGFHAQWLDDFHHALYVLLDEKGKERYEDFGALEQLAKAYNDGFVLSGEYVRFRKRKYGASSSGIPGDRFVNFIMNHDQVGNRPDGARLSTLINLDRQKLAAAALLLAPYIPMLFMGEEYGETAPFFYFVDHRDPELIRAVSEGRKKEFDWNSSNIPFREAHDEKTFADSILHWENRNEGSYAVLHRWYRALLALRKKSDVLREFDKAYISSKVIQDRGVMLDRRSRSDTDRIVGFLNFSKETIRVELPSGKWEKILDSEDPIWRDPTTSSTSNSHDVSNTIAPGGVVVFRTNQTTNDSEDPDVP